MLGRLAASAAPMPWEQPSGCPCVRRGLSPPPPDGWWPGRASAAGPRTRAISAPSRAPLTRRGARFVATGTSMRVAERAGGRGPTVHIPGVAAAAAAAAAALATARRSRSSGFQGACSASVWRGARCSTPQRAWAARRGSGAAAAGPGPLWRSPTATPGPALAPEKRARCSYRGL